MVPANPKLRTGEILIKQGLITSAQLDIALAEQRERQTNQSFLPIAEILIRNKFCSREQAEAAVALTKEGGISGLFNLLLPQVICQRYKVMPERVEDGVLLLKAAAPLTPEQQRLILAAALVSVSRLRIRPVSRRELEHDFSRVFVDAQVLADCLEALRKSEPTGSLIQATIKALLKEAMDARASDIHLDYKGDADSWISWRVDGGLQRKYLVPRRVMGPLFIRMKTEAGMDASETRREQDGRIHHQRAGRVMDLRVSAMPIAGGEGLVLRILDGESAPDLHQMFPGQSRIMTAVQRYLDVKEKRGGLILVSGQTGSGKTTTLHGFARLLPRDRINLVTVEDPVELEMPLTKQFQPNALLNQNMAQIERTLLRQDPDAVIIGEIRDADSACTALKMAESGHMVLTTIHAESAEQALMRLASMAAERESRDWASFVIAQFLKLSISQSLRAKPCVHCSTSTPEGLRLNKSGCPHCVNGWRGRVLVHDTLMTTGRISEEERHNIQLALKEGSLKRLAELCAMEGMMKQTRQETMAILVKERLLALDDLQEFEARSL